jgi:uncharacterized protein (DUF2235 family)
MAQPPRNTFVLCFDGTGNKFSGTDSDSNILKIYRMLDRTQGNTFHYYQPGIGTYVTSNSLEHTGVFARLKSWYDKAKDSAIGTAFADHVMGGYRFLMRYYSPGDDIYFFGFSRGAYTARFLAEMLDHVGLLSAGNEELSRFAWKTFSKWQARRGADREKEAEMYKFMTNFRETFSRPVSALGCASEKILHYHLKVADVGADYAVMLTIALPLLPFGRGFNCQSGRDIFLANNLMLLLASLLISTHSRQSHALISLL